MANVENEWTFQDEEQKKKWQEEITKQNCGEKLKLVRELAAISRRELAKILGCSEATIRRIESGASEPTDAFMNRLRALCLIGKARFEAMTDAEKEKISEYIGTAGGVTAGIGGAIAAIASAGTVSGLSAAGITSGLAAIGGSMLTGIGVVAAIPIATGLLGYGLVKGIKAICEANDLDSQEVNGYWEIKKK